jgi:tetratricopeptide (TPR) repeat protein
MSTPQALPSTPPVASNETDKPAAGAPRAADATTERMAVPGAPLTPGSDVILATRAAAGAGHVLTLPVFDSTEAPPHIEGCEILGMLGHGGMGVVYRALQTELKRIVAIKMIHSSALADPLAQQRFLGEARAIARLQHPNIVGLFEIGKHEGVPYFVLEYVPGGSLAALIKGQPQPPRQAAELMVKLARAVQAAHAQGVVHRDLKPLNVLLAADGEPKITDFGLAKLVQEPGPRTRTGEIVGTPYYMAPEQVDQRAPGIGPLTDVYALGAMLYELLTGRPPHQGVTPMETLMLVLHREPVPPRRLCPGVPRDLETICLKCLRKDAARRYASAADLADDLQRFLAGRPIQARQLSPPQRIWLWARRNPVVAALSLALIALLGGGLILVGQLYLDAQGNLEEARRQSVLAREAVDKLTTVGDELEDAADIHRVRVEMLRESLDFYQRFLQDRGRDPALRRQTARAYRRVGDLHYQLGNLAESLDGFQMAGQILQALQARQPNDAALAYELGLTWKGYGNTLASLRRFADAEAAYRKTIELAEALLQSEARPLHRRLLADALNNLGVLLTAQGRLAEADQALVRALAIRAADAGDDPRSTPKRLLLAATTCNHAFLLMRQDRHADAETQHLSALRMRKEAQQAQPGGSAQRQALADSHAALGEFYLHQGRLPTAQIMLQEAVRLRGGLATDFPTVPHYRRDHADALVDYGVLLLRLERAADAGFQLRLAADIWNKLAADYPKRADFSRRAALVGGYAAALAGNGAAAADAAQAVLAQPAAEAESLFFAARVLALAATRTADAAQQERWLRLTLDALRRSWNMDYFRARWRPRDLAALPEFIPLLGRADFMQELLSSLPEP